MVAGWIFMFFIAMISVSSASWSLLVLSSSSSSQSTNNQTDALVTSLTTTELCILTSQSPTVQQCEDYPFRCNPQYGWWVVVLILSILSTFVLLPVSAIKPQVFVTCQVSCWKHLAAKSQRCYRRSADPLQDDVQPPRVCLARHAHAVLLLLLASFIMLLVMVSWKTSCISRLVTSLDTTNDDIVIMQQHLLAVYHFGLVICVLTLLVSLAYFLATHCNLLPSTTVYRTLHSYTGQ